MGRRIVILDGHPDPAAGRLCRALADAYADGARAVGHAVTRVEAARLDFPLLRSKTEFETGGVPPALAACQAAVGEADHLVIVYPLWLGAMPALLKALLEQVFRPGFAFDVQGPAWRKRLHGKSARIVVTMGMPVFVYRWYFGAHSLKSLERSILGFCGIGPIRESLFGGVDAASPAKRQKWLAAMRRLGEQGR
jgi:putative NADPH-quinone reductase